MREGGWEKVQVDLAYKNGMKCHDKFPGAMAIHINESVKIVMKS